MSHGHGHCHCSCGIFGIFLGFFTGVVWLLLVVLEIIPKFFTLIHLGAFGAILNIIIAIIGFLACLVFGLCIFKKAWRCCKK